MPTSKEDFGNLWHQVHREMGEHFRQAFRGCEMPPITMILIQHIQRNPGLTVSELARQTGTVKSHVSKLIDQLVARGFAEKRSDPADQRLIRVYPTGGAESSIAETQARFHQAWAQIIDEVPEEQLQALVFGVKGLLAALQKHTGKADQTETAQVK